jgi:hypothetical protein
MKLLTLTREDFDGRFISKWEYTPDPFNYDDERYLEHDPSEFTGTIADWLNDDRINRMFRIRAFFSGMQFADDCIQEEILKKFCFKLAGKFVITVVGDPWEITAEDVFHRFMQNTDPRKSLDENIVIYRDKILFALKSAIDSVNEVVK